MTAFHGGMRRVSPQLFALTLAFAPVAHAQIFADVVTTKGNFTIQLNHTAAPKAVANFIGLAEGSRVWINPLTGAVHTNEPYYTGVIFHRVIADFMSQTGSRKGDGSDGPGYAFQDELNNGLTHSGPHVVSMANSGPISNGSQFFITDVATPHLNGKHTVFGAISSGQSVVNAINNSPTASEKPVTPIVIQSITIRREGTAANAFDIHAQGLPVVTQPKALIKAIKGGAASALFTPDLAPRTQFRAFRSTNLAAWATLGQLYIPKDGEPVDKVDGIELEAPEKAFYQFAAVSYPQDPVFSNPALASYSLNLGSQTRVYVFNAAGTGGNVTITLGGGSPTVIPFTLRSTGNAPYLSQLVIDHGASSTPRYLRHTLYADTSTASSFSGRMIADQSSQHNGPWFTWGSGSYTASH
jgi:peptidyl-prolyl cis-trans isomerase A (cyclophilin A)